MAKVAETATRARVKLYLHLQIKIFSEISAKNDFYHNAAGQRAAILVSPLVCLRSTTLRMNGSHAWLLRLHTVLTRIARGYGQTREGRSAALAFAARHGISASAGAAEHYHK